MIDWLDTTLVTSQKKFDKRSFALMSTTETNFGSIVVKAPKYYLEKEEVKKLPKKAMWQW